MREVIRASGIAKKFETTQALKDISFSVNKGEIFGFIGPDGAGKTTLFRIITTLLLPDEGNISVLGLDTLTGFKELRKNIGYMPGRFSLYQDLTVEENLKFYATVFGTSVSENYDLISEIYKHIEPFRNRLAGNLSGGIAETCLVCALIHKPHYLFLTNQPPCRRSIKVRILGMLRKLRVHNITIVVSTPYMDEAMRCDRVALIQKGQILQSMNLKDKRRIQP